MRFFLACSLLLGVACAEGASSDRRSSDRSSVDGGRTGTPDAGQSDFGPNPIDLGPGTTPDSGHPDLGPPVACTTAAECDDGLVCNGVEACAAGVCQAGAPVPCDDGIACTRDACSEATGSCTFTPDDTLCGAGQTCGAAGCSTTACSESPCKLVSPQCGCGAGQACFMDPDGVRSCAAPGSTDTGGACSVIADCRGGDTCLGLGDTVGGCHHFCNSDSDCSGAGSLCLLDLADTGGATIPGATVCTLSCEPAQNSGCPAGSYCFLGQEPTGAMRDLSHCSGEIPGTGTQGSLCDDTGDCSPGYLCLDPGTGVPECLHLCRNPSASPTSSPDCTSSFYSCYGFTTPVLLGGTAYGVCDF
ncbi:MAG: hypothetical protein CMN30_28485 [Sandaracinus sp.]|nr:hypothetical protein [Sandaracinus sp.]